MLPTSTHEFSNEIFKAVSVSSCLAPSLLLPAFSPTSSSSLPTCLLPSYLPPSTLLSLKSALGAQQANGAHMAHLLILGCCLQGEGGLIASEEASGLQSKLNWAL